MAPPPANSRLILLVLERFPDYRRMHPLVTIATNAARAAGNFIMRSMNHIDQLQIEKKGRSDFVTQVDRGAEAEIIKIIRRAYPQHAILGEETGADGDSDTVWIIDPLDGTTNFLHGIPHFAVSIGIQVRGKLEHGVIYAPSTQDLYTATRGSGAVLNNRKIRVSNAKDMESALFGTGVPINPDLLDTYLPTMRAIAGNSAGIRRAGSAALDLAYVACGRLDGYWEIGLKPWDIAAGLVLVREAGGIVDELYEDGEPLQTGNVLAAGPKIYPQMAEILNAARR